MNQQRIPISQSPRVKSSAEFFSEKYSLGQHQQQSMRFHNQMRKQNSDMTSLTNRLKPFKLNENIKFQTSPSEKQVDKQFGDEMMQGNSEKIEIHSYITTNFEEPKQGANKLVFPSPEKGFKTQFSEMMSQKYQQLIQEQQLMKTHRDFKQQQKISKNFMFNESSQQKNEGIDNYFINQDFTHGKVLRSKQSKKISNTLSKAQSEDCFKPHESIQQSLNYDYSPLSVIITNRNNITNNTSNVQSTAKLQKEGGQNRVASFWKVKQSAVIKNITCQGQQSSPNLNQLSKHHKKSINGIYNSNPNTTKVLKRFNLEEMNVKMPQKQTLANQFNKEIPSPESPLKFKKIVRLINTDGKKDANLRKVSSIQNFSQQMQQSSQFDVKSQPSTFLDLNTFSSDSPLFNFSKLSPLSKKSSRNIKKVQSSPFLMPLNFSPKANHTSNTYTPLQQSPTSFSQALIFSSSKEISPLNQPQQKTPFRLVLNKSNHQTMQPQSSIDSDKNLSLKSNEEVSGIVGSFLNMQKSKNSTDQQNITTSSFSKNQNQNNNAQQILTPTTQTASFFQKSPLLSYSEMTPQLRKQPPPISIQKIDSLAFIDSPFLNSQPLKYQKSIIIEEEFNLNADASPRAIERNRERKASIKDSTDREFKKRGSICKESISPVYRKTYQRLKSMTDDSIMVDSISLTSSPLTLSSKLRAREASFVIENRMEEIKQHLLSEFSQEKELISIVEDFCLIKSHEFINEIIRFLKYAIESYNKRKLIEKQQNSSTSPSDRQNNNSHIHNAETCGHHHHHHHLMANDDNQMNNTMKFQIIPKILLDWVIHQIFQKMKSFKIDGDNLFAYLVELAITHLLPHNLFEELGSEKGIRNWILKIMEKLDQIIGLDSDLITSRLNDIYQIVVSILHNNFANISNIYSLFQLNHNFTSIEFYLLKKVFIDSFSSPSSKINQTKSFKGTQTICQLIDYYSINADKAIEQIVQQDGYVNSYIKNEILTRIEICRNILMNRTSPLNEEQFITQISLHLNNEFGFNRQKKSTQSLKATELFITELCSVFYQNKEKRQTFLSQQKNKFVDSYDSQFWQYINLAFEKIMNNNHNYELSNKSLQIDINLQLYLLEIESYQLETEYRSVFDYIENIQVLISELFIWVEEAYFNMGGVFPVDVISGFDKSFMNFFLETALSQGSYSASDLQQAASYHKVNKELFNFWMKGLSQVTKSNKFNLTNQEQGDLIAFLSNIVPPF